MKLLFGTVVVLLLALSRKAAAKDEGVLKMLANGRSLDHMLEIQKHFDQFKSRSRRAAQIVDGEAKIVDQFSNRTMPKKIAPVRELTGHERPLLSDVNYQIADYLYQGDINLNLEQAQYLAQFQRGDRAARAAPFSYRPEVFLWPKDQLIAYSLDYIKNDKLKDIIRQAIMFWTQNGCRQFEENGTQRPFINFTDSLVGCWSSLGRQKDSEAQTVSLGSGCDYYDTVIHEIGHALGFHHTQTRHDRDDYISVDLSNVDPEKTSNFVKLSPEENDNFGYPYDFHSVMQYSDRAFARNRSLPTMLAKDQRYQKTMGSGKHSWGDVYAMNKLYKCDGKCASQQSICQNGGIIFETRSCNACRCPLMFDKGTCTTRVMQRGGYMCGGTLLASEEYQVVTPEVKYNKDMMMGSYMEAECIYFIEAPEGQKVSIKMIKAGDYTYCATDCYWRGVNLFMNGYTKPPFTYCCETDVQNEEFVSEGNVAVLRGYSGSGSYSFEFAYKFV